MKTSVIRNYLYNISYQFLILVLPLITTPYISRVLGADGVGAFGYTESITQYFVLFGCVGLNLYGQREIAYCQSNLVKRSEVFWELLIVRVMTVSIALIIYVFTVCNIKEYQYLFKIQIIEVLTAMIDISWFFQGMEEFKKIVIRNALVKICGVILTFLLVKEKNDLNRYAFICVFTLFFGNLSMWLYCSQFIQKIKSSELNIRRHIKPALILFVPQIATNMYNLLDKSMIGFLTKSDVEVAYYEQAQKIMKMALSIPTALGTVMLPRIASMFEKGKNDAIKIYLNESLQFICMLSFPLCMGLCVISKGFVPWFFGSGYEKVVGNLIILSPIIVIVGISNVIGVQYLLPIGRQKQYTYSVVIGTLVNFTLNMVAIPKLLSYGAAIASIIAELAVSGSQLYMVREIFPIKVMIRKVYKYIAASMIMAIFVKQWYLWNLDDLCTTMLQILSGVVIYFISLLLMREKMILNFVKNVMKI